MLEELRDQNIDAALEAYDDVEAEYSKYCNAILEWNRKSKI